MLDDIKQVVGVGGDNGDCHAYSPPFLSSLMVRFLLYYAYSRIVYTAIRILSREMT